jgi:23S rRNA (guanosine2251-2'-O)-methyltransferase
VLDKKQVPSWISVIPKDVVSYVSEDVMVRMLPKHAVHQGIAIKLRNITSRDISALSDTPQNCVVVMLDGVTDPHNVGAIIRTAAAFGVSGIILPERSSCDINGTVVKAASGGVEMVPLYIVGNLARTIEELKSYGFWVVAFSEAGAIFPHELDLTGKVCLIFGSEGSGIRKRQIDNSDFVAKLPTNQDFTTLNVSATAAIAFYEVARQGGFKLQRDC